MLWYIMCSKHVSEGILQLEIQKLWSASRCPVHPPPEVTPETPCAPSSQKSWIRHCKKQLVFFRILRRPRFVSFCSVALIGCHVFSHAAGSCWFRYSWSNRLLERCCTRTTHELDNYGWKDYRCDLCCGSWSGCGSWGWVWIVFLLGTIYTIRVIIHSGPSILGIPQSVETSLHISKMSICCYIIACVMDMGTMLTMATASYNRLSLSLDLDLHWYLRVTEISALF